MLQEHRDNKFGFAAPAVAFALMAMTVLAANGQDGTVVSLEACPAAVQKTINAKAGQAPIVDITKYNEDGRAEYSATIRQDGRERDLNVGENGDFLGWEEVVALKECPAAVQNTIKARAGFATVVEIIKATDDEGVGYSVTIRRGPRQREFTVAADGEFLGWED